MADSAPKGDTGNEPEDAQRKEGSRSALPATLLTRHLWQIQPIRDLLVLAAIFGLLYLGYKLSLVTVPLLLAMLLAYLLEPVVKALTRVKWISRRIAALIIIFGTIIVIGGPLIIGGAIAIAQTADLVDTLGTNVNRLVRSVQSPEDGRLRDALPGEAWQDFRDLIVEWQAAAAEEGQVADEEAPREGAAPDETAPGDEGPTVEEPMVGAEIGLFVFGLLEEAGVWWRDNRGQLSRQAIRTGADAVTFVIRTLTSLGFLLFAAFLTAFFFFFITVGWGHVLQFWEDLIPERRRGEFIELGEKMDRVISGFIRGRLTIAAILAAFYILSYWLIGVPAALLIGALVGVLSIAPYLSLIGIPVAIILLWLEPNSPAWRDSIWWTLIAPTAVYFAGQTADDYLLSPSIQGKSTNMDAPTILFASLAGGVLAGVYGVLVAIPVAACIKIVVIEVLWPRVKAWTKGEEPDPLPFGGRPREQDEDER